MARLLGQTDDPVGGEGAGGLTQRACRPAWSLPGICTHAGAHACVAAPVCLYAHTRTSMHTHLNARGPRRCPRSYAASRTRPSCWRCGSCLPSAASSAARRCECMAHCRVPLLQGAGCNAALHGGTCPAPSPARGIRRTDAHAHAHPRTHGHARARRGRARTAVAGPQQRRAASWRGGPGAAATGCSCLRRWAVLACAELS